MFVWLAVFFWSLAFAFCFICGCRTCGNDHLRAVVLTRWNDETFAKQGFYSVRAASTG
jgi:hypothetical protein